MNHVQRVLEHGKRRSSSAFLVGNDSEVLPIHPVDRGRMAQVVRVVVEVHHVKAALERGESRGSLALVGGAVVVGPSRATEGRVPNDIRSVAEMQHVEAIQKRRECRRGLALLVGDQPLIAAADIHLDDLLAALPADLALAA